MTWCLLWAYDDDFLCDQSVNTLLKKSQTQEFIVKFGIFVISEIRNANSNAFLTFDLSKKRLCIIWIQAHFLGIYMGSSNVNTVHLYIFHCIILNGCKENVGIRFNAQFLMPQRIYLKWKSHALLLIELHFYGFAVLGTFYSLQFLALKK